MSLCIVILPKKRRRTMQNSKRFFDHIEVITEKDPGFIEYKWSVSNGLSNLKKIFLTESPADNSMGETEILDICREHYSEYLGNMGDQFGKILTYRYHFGPDRYIEYMLPDVVRRSF